MAEEFLAIVDVEATAEQAPGLAEGLVRWLIAEGIVAPELTVHGPEYRPGPNFRTACAYEPAAGSRFLTGGGFRVEVDTSRRVYYQIEGTQTLTCRSCGKVIAVKDETGNLTEAYRQILDLIETWYETGEAHGRCAGCGREMSLNDWDWAPYAWGFGYLGLLFWNWPGLRPQFIAEVSRRLGHRTVYTGW